MCVTGPNFSALLLRFSFGLPFKNLTEWKTICNNLNGHGHNQPTTTTTTTTKTTSPTTTTTTITTTTATTNNNDDGYTDDGPLREYHCDGDYAYDYHQYYCYYGGVALLRPSRCQNHQFLIGNLIGETSRHGNQPILLGDFNQNRRTGV